MIVEATTGVGAIVINRYISGCLYRKGFQLLLFSVNDNNPEKQPKLSFNNMKGELCQRALFLLDSNSTGQLVFRSSLVLVETCVPIFAQSIGGFQSSVAAEFGLYSLIGDACQKAGIPDGDTAVTLMCERLKLGAVVQATLRRGAKLLLLPGGVKKVKSPIDAFWLNALHGGGNEGIKIHTPIVTPLIEEFGFTENCGNNKYVDIKTLSIFIDTNAKLDIPGMSRVKLSTFPLGIILLMVISHQIPYMNNLYYVISVVNLFKDFNTYYHIIPNIKYVISTYSISTNLVSKVELNDQYGNVNIESFILALD